jgi:RNA polymerase sigma factor (TIGR02999 family)
MWMPASDDPVPPDQSPGPTGSTEDLFALLYRELHSLASRQLHRQAGGATLGTTTLLHELYLNIAGRSPGLFPDRARFLGYASRAMRGLIIDYVRRRSAAKRGGEFVLLPLGTEPGASALEGSDMEELSAALDQLGQVDPGLSELVDLHFFCGLSFVEIAALRGVSDRTVQREWRKARLLLHRELRPGARVSLE